MATYTIQYPGNTALETQIWTLTLAEAKTVLDLMHPEPGTFWDTELQKPYRRAKRAKAATVRVRTAHFSTSEFSNALFNCDIEKTEVIPEGAPAMPATKKSRKTRTLNIVPASSPDAGPS